MKSPSFGKILVRVPNWVGDAVMAEPALRHLRCFFANAHIAIVARPWVAGLYEGEGLADEIITTHVRGVGSFISECRRLREKGFDAAILLQNAFGAALFARGSGIRTVAGYPTDRRRLLLDPVIPLDPDHKKRHQVHYYLGIASFLELMVNGRNGLTVPGPESLSGDDAVTPRLRATLDARDRAASLLADEGIEGGGRTGAAPLLVLNPGATNSRAKRWLPQRFAE